MTEPRYCLDLFAGLKTFSRAFEESDDWEVISVDKREEFTVDDGDTTKTVEVEHDYVCDIRALEAGDFEHEFDVVLASPPCPTYSMAAISDHRPDDSENSADAVNADSLLRHLYNLIKELNPQWWWVENPRGKMRKLPPFYEPSGTITLCQYERDHDRPRRMKPTDLWGKHPDSFEYHSCSRGADCHVEAKRGSNTGTQGLTTKATRSTLPRGLSEAILEAVENPGQTHLQATFGETTTVWPEPTGMKAYCSFCLQEVDGWENPGRTDDWRCPSCKSWLIEESQYSASICERCHSLFLGSRSYCGVCDENVDADPYSCWEHEPCDCAKGPSHVIDWDARVFHIPANYAPHELPQESQIIDAQPLPEEHILDVLGGACADCGAIVKIAERHVETRTAADDPAPWAVKQTASG
jgi:hypothetical protein